MSVANIVLSFTANYGSAIKDIPAFLALANDFKRSGNIFGKYDITIRNGREYIVFKGNPRLRKIIQGTRYLLTNTKIINIGIGKEGIRSNGVGGVYIGLLVSTTLDTINWIFKDNYRWTNWLGTISTDIVKAAIGYAAYALTAGFIGMGSVAIVASFSGILVGVLVGYGLTVLDERYHITDLVINSLNHVEKKVPLLADSIYEFHLNAAREVINFFEIDINKIGILYNKAVAK